MAVSVMEKNKGRRLHGGARTLGGQTRVLPPVVVALSRKTKTLLPSPNLKQTNNNQAAETGSGKTGAFALPILQAVHETLRARVRRALAAPGTASKARMFPHVAHLQLCQQPSAPVAAAVAPRGRQGLARVRARQPGRSLPRIHADKL